MWQDFRKYKKAELGDIPEGHKNRRNDAEMIIKGIRIFELRVFENKTIEETRQQMKLEYEGAFSNRTMQDYLNRARNSFVDSFYHN